MLFFLFLGSFGGKASEFETVKEGGKPVDFEMRKDVASVERRKGCCE